MFPNSVRKEPIKTTLFTAVFPGYYLWSEDRKIEAVTISIAVYLGYIIIIGLYVELFMLYYNWKKTKQFNEINGFQLLVPKEEKRLAFLGVVGGSLAHPFFLLFSYYWFTLLELGTQASDTIFQVNRVAFVFILIVIFMLRVLLFYSLRQTRCETKSEELATELQRFGRNNSSTIILLPLLYLILYPIQEGMFAIILLTVLLPLSFIFGLRILYNNLKELRFLD